jgi:acyl-CoA thioesterase-2
MHPTFDRLLTVLDIRSKGDGAYEASSPDPGAMRLFGGQVLAQALAATHREEGGALAHSMHAYFLQRGTPAETIHLQATLLRRSRAFRTWQVTATQSVGPILQMIVSYHDAEPGVDHQIPMDEVGPPSGEAYEQALIDVMTPGALGRQQVEFELPVEIRGVGGLALFSSEVKPPQARCWMRMRGELPDDLAVQEALIRPLREGAPLGG